MSESNGTSDTLRGTFAEAFSAFTFSKLNATDGQSVFLYKQIKIWHFQA
jgi:hypothetical protein